MRSGPGEIRPQNKKRKKITMVGRKKKDYDEPHVAPNEKMQPIQWTERPTGALVAAGSL